jgi:hypothetical protein
MPVKLPPGWTENCRRSGLAVTPFGNPQGTQRRPFDLLQGCHPRQRLRGPLVRRRQGRGDREVCSRCGRMSRREGRGNQPPDALSWFERLKSTQSGRSFCSIALGAVAPLRPSRRSSAPRANSGAAIRVRPAGPYSITSSACASKIAGTIRPSAFAVFMLMTSSNRVGWITGKSAGFSPFRMRPT